MIPHHRPFRLPRRVSITFAFCLLLCSLCASAEAAGSGPKQLATITKVPSGVQIRGNRSASWEPARPDTKLVSGATLQTATLPIEVRLIDGSALTLHPSTVVQFQDPTEVACDRGPPTKVMRVDIKQGEVKIRMADKAERPLLVVVPDDIYAVFRSGKARLKTVNDGIFAAVDGGVARIAAQGRWTTLEGNTYSTFRAHSKSDPVRPLAAAPALGAPCVAQAAKPCGLAVSDPLGKVPLGLHWSPVALAQQFKVTIARDPLMQEVVQQQTIPGSSTSFVTSPLPAGMYYALVRSVTADGVDGGEAGPRAMRVVTLKGEPGVVVLGATSTAVLPPGRSLSIEQPSGLEMATGKNWDEVPDKFGLLTDDKSRTVRIRMTNDPSEHVALTLEPRALIADVSLTPRLARWPQDPVHVSIKLTDPTGRISATSVTPSIQVKINRDEVHPKFVQEGQTWKAQIPPRPGPGPWVVRVEVVDEFGSMLGRDFLEVEGLPADRRTVNW